MADFSLLKSIPNQILKTSTNSTQPEMATNAGSFTSNTSTTYPNQTNLNPVQNKLFGNVMKTAAATTKDPIQKAVIGNIMKTLPTKKPSEKSKCVTCDIEIDKNTMEAHLKGKKHAKMLRMKTAAAAAAGQSGSATKTPSGSSSDLSGQKKLPIVNTQLECKPCGIFANSEAQLKAHEKSSKHLTKIGLGSSTTLKAGVKPGAGNKTASKQASQTDGATPAKKAKEESLTYSCKPCNTEMNSKAQYDQHMASNKHKNKLMFKPNNNNRGVGNRWGGNRYNNFNTFEQGKKGFGFNKPLNSSFVPSQGNAFNSSFPISSNMSQYQLQYTERAMKDQAMELVKKADELVSQANMLRQQYDNKTNKPGDLFDNSVKKFDSASKYKPYNSTGSAYQYNANTNSYYDEYNNTNTDMSSNFIQDKRFKKPVTSSYKPYNMDYSAPPLSDTAVPFRVNNTNMGIIPNKTQYNNGW